MFTYSIGSKSTFIINFLYTISSSDIFLSLFIFLLNLEQRGGRQRNTMAIGKYKLLFQTNSLSQAWTIFGSKLLHFVHTREKRKEKRKTLHLFVSSPSTCFIGHPLSTSRTRHSNAFSPLFFSFFSRGRLSFGISD